MKLGPWAKETDKELATNTAGAVMGERTERPALGTFISVRQRGTNLTNAEIFMYKNSPHSVDDSKKKIQTWN